MIHRQEMRSFFGVPASHMVGLEDAQQIILAMILCRIPPAACCWQPMQIARAFRWASLRRFSS